MLTAVLGPRVGRQIDLVGGRSVLSISNLTLAAGLALLGLTSSIPMLVAAWLMLGIGMSLGLYDAAFGALGRIYGDAARGAITGITLMAGFASTIGWPLTALGLESIGWRNTCFAWALAHLLIGLPLNLLMIPPIEGTKATAEAAARPHIPIDRTMALLAFALRRGLERDRCDGGASAADPRSHGRHHAAGGLGRRLDWPGAGRSPHRRGEFPEPLPSAGLDSDLPASPIRSAQ